MTGKQLKKLKEQTLAQTAKCLNDTGMPLPKNLEGAGISRGEFFLASMIHGVLLLKSYTGIRVYKIGDRHEEVKTAWARLLTISRRTGSEAFKRHKSHKKPPHPKRFPFQLSSLCFCAKCGDRMSSKTAQGIWLETQKEGPEEKLKKKLSW